MRNLKELVSVRISELNNGSKGKFNTNDFLLETLLNKTIDRTKMIELILLKRLELEGITDESISKMTKEEQSKVMDRIEKLTKTSKNGLDTSVSDSQNNSSFSFNEKYSDYKLIKKGSTLRIEKK